MESSNNSRTDLQHSRAVETAAEDPVQTGAQESDNGIQMDEQLLQVLFVIDFSLFLASGVGNTIHGSPLLPSCLCSLLPHGGHM